MFILKRCKKLKTTRNSRISVPYTTDVSGPEPMRDTDKVLEKLRTEPFEQKEYPFWGRNIKEWEEIHLGQYGSGGFLKMLRTQLHLRKWTAFVPNLFELNTFAKDASNAYLSLSDRFADNDIQEIEARSTPWVRAVLKNWQNHCRELKVDKVVDSKTTAIAFLMNPTDINQKKRHSVLGRKSAYLPQVDHGNRLFHFPGSAAVSTVSYEDFFDHISETKSYDSYLVAWAAFDVKENFTIVDNSTGTKTRITESRYPTRHLWKFGASLKSNQQQFSWQVLDIDFLVAEKLKVIREKHNMVVDTLPMEEEFWQDVI
eukprot:TRINITY_DN6114_c0_g1_i1.p1 TRINITY_DN6114_c0_g1~~TRINITY_DN6114_c0_g1_i1.p1  ORF type:complete len:314 (-),score=53.74 TRINITY_DN6114_c0_g1_i1:60-1001(-)